MSESLLSLSMKKCKKDFKEVAGRTLKVEEVGTNDTVEIISTSPYTLKRPAYYKRITSFRIL